MPPKLLWPHLLLFCDLLIVPGTHQAHFHLRPLPVSLLNNVLQVSLCGQLPLSSHLLGKSYCGHCISNRQHGPRILHRDIKPISDGLRKLNVLKTFISSRYYSTHNKHGLCRVGPAFKEHSGMIHHNYSGGSCAYFDWLLIMLFRCKCVFF